MQMTKLLRIAMAVVVGALLITGLAACGGDDDSDDGGTTPPPESTQAAVQTEPAGAATEPAGNATEPAGNATEPAGDGLESLTVTASDFAFDADLTSVAAGSVVQVAFSNNGSSPHTLTFYTDADYTEAIPGGDSGQLASGGSFNFTFEAPEDGTVFYRCEVHPDQMEGELTID